MSKHASKQDKSATATIEEDVEDLSTHTDKFRRLLQDEFQIFHCDDNPASVRVPAISITAIKRDPNLLKSLLRKSPHDLIKFKTSKPSAMEYHPLPKLDKRLVRIRNYKTVPLGVWANWVVSHRLFSTVVILLIVINSLGLGIQNELERANHWQLFLVFDFIDDFSLIMFTLEIILKWMDNFEEFWDSGWNVFDFVVTVLSAIPTILEFTGGDNTQIGRVATQLRVFRIFRSLKMIARLRNLRLIITTILNAFANMGFILLLMGIMAFMFGIFAINLFESYTHSKRPGLLYQEKFSDLPQALITLFQLFTLDQWYSIEADVRLVVNPAISIVFFVTWVWIGAFIFRNIFVGVMVRNFQKISHKMVRADDAIRKQKNLEQKQHKIHEMLKTTKGIDDWNRNSSVDLEDLSRSMVDESFEKLTAQIESKAITEASRWSRLMEESIESFKTLKKEHSWPSDVLFQYLRVLMRLQENGSEFNELQHLLAIALSNLNEKSSSISSKKAAL